MGIYTDIWSETICLMKNIRAIIIDDELSCRDSLEILINEFISGVEVIAKCENITAGFEAINEDQPDIVFLDIEMPNGTGFDLLEKFDQIDFDVVFTTAYNQYAIQAIKANALDYLLKPVQINELQECINKKKETLGESSEGSQIEQLLASLSKPQKSRLMVSSIEGFDIVEMDEIIHIKGDLQYSIIHVENGKNLTVSKNLNQMAKELNDSFCRVHKSHIINLNKVKNYIKGSGGQVLMDNGDVIDIARRRKEEFLEQLKNTL